MGEQKYIVCSLKSLYRYFTLSVVVCLYVILFSVVRVSGRGSTNISGATSNGT